MHSSRSRASTAFFSPLPLADLTAKRRFLLKEGKKEEEKICGREKREEEKKEERPHQQCCQVYNKCTAYTHLSFFYDRTQRPDMVLQDD
jgi:hypothetical protein